MSGVLAREEVDRIVHKFAELLTKKLKVKCMYFYGSYASGTPRKDSDIDIAVVSESFTGDMVDDTMVLMRIRRKVDTRIEPHPFLPEDFNKENPLADEILKNGIKIV